MMVMNEALRLEIMPLLPDIINKKETVQTIEEKIR